MGENFRAFMELDESRYVNEYVVIVKGKVIAGEDAERLLSEAKKQFPDEIPLIAKIPPQEVLVL